MCQYSLNANTICEKYETIFESLFKLLESHILGVGIYLSIYQGSTYLPIYLPNYLPSLYQPIYLPSPYLPIYVPIYLPSLYLHTYLRTYLSTKSLATYCVVNLIFCQNCSFLASTLFPYFRGLKKFHQMKTKYLSCIRTRIIRIGEYTGRRHHGKRLSI